VSGCSEHPTLRMKLLSTFVRNVRGAFGTGGQAWLEALPDLVDEAVQRWGLTDVQPVPELSYNWVAFALDGGGNERVLKLGVPNRELTGEIAALRYYAGQGAVRLLEADAEKGMLLLERLRPGHMLSSLPDDDQATAIAAQVLTRLHAPAQEQSEFMLLRDWFDGLGGLRQRFEGGTGPFPAQVVEAAEGLIADFFSEDRPQVLLHGDFHHFNILESNRGWLAIDPKGVIGYPEYELGPFLINPLSRLDQPDATHLSARRLAILSERLGFDSERIRGWAIAYAVLSAWWSLNEAGADWEYAIHCAQVFLTIEI
jgi:streptomycin 6-kinase